MTEAAAPALSSHDSSVDGPRYGRVLLKISGEALLGDQPYGVDPEFCRFIAKQVGAVHALGVQVAIVVVI